jgi:hypothetical protein
MPESFEIVEPPYCRMLRELSPWVPMSVREQMALGEPPVAIRGISHPVVVLLRERWKSLKIDRKEFARLHGGNTGYAKTIRRVDELFEGKRRLPEWIERVACVLQISLEEMQAAWQTEADWLAARNLFRLRQRRHRIYADHSSYLLVMRSANANPDACVPPSPHSIESFYEVHGNAEPDLLIPWMQQHREHWICGKVPVHGYLYVRAPEDLHFFLADGTLISFGDSCTPTPQGFYEYQGCELKL